MNIKSHVIKKGTLCCHKFYKIVTIVDGRKFVDCESFALRSDAEKMIPAIERDIKESIERGIL